MGDPVQKTARVIKPKDAPYQVFKLLPYVDSILDIVSLKPGKKERSNDLFSELKDSRAKAKNEYEEKQKEGVQGSQLMVLKNKFDYLDTILANTVNLVNSFDTMQTLWHLKTDEISTYYESKIGAGGFASNFKRFVPWLFTPAVVIVSYVTGAWNDVHQLIGDAFAKWQLGMVNMAIFASDVLGVIGLVFASTRISQRANDWVHSIRKERDGKLRHFFEQEIAVRKAIHDTIQQIALGLSTEFGYTNELKRVGEKDLLAAKGNLEQIWKTVSERIKGIQKKLPKSIRDLFASSLDLPDYIASIAKQIEKKVQKPEEKKQ